MKKWLATQLLLLTFFAVTAQTEPCEVLADSLKGTYTGDCRKGLAHGNGTAEGTDKYTGEFKKGMPDGQGTYIWKTGAYYTGNWKKGMRDGKGTMHPVGKDTSVVKGYWKKDEYKGEYEYPWVFHRLPNVLNKTVQKIDNRTNTVLIKVEAGVAGRADVSKFTLMGGNYMRYDTRIQSVRAEIEFQHVIFPFRVRLESGGDFVDIEVFEAGNWEIFLKY
jgi:hypothetical protein